MAMADDTATEEHLLFVIDGNRLISVSPDMVFSSKKIVIVQDYMVVRINYTSANGTVLKSGTITGNMITLERYDGAHLILKDKENNIIMDITVHEMNVANFFTYVFPLQYQQIIITVLLSFIASVLVVVAFYINKETRLL